MSEKEIKLNIDVKVPEEIQMGLKSIEEKVDSIVIPEQKDYTEQFKLIMDKLNEEEPEEYEDEDEEIIVKLNII